MIYVADQTNGRIKVWLNSSINSTNTISGNLSAVYSIFVTSSGDIYVSNNYSTNGVDKRTLNANISISVMSVNSPCYGLFVDISNILYCSMPDSHQVVTKSLSSVSKILTTVAGICHAGSTLTMLNSGGARGGHEGAQHPLRTFAPPLAKFLEDEFFSDTIMYKRGKAIFLDFNPEKSEKKILKIQKIRKNPKKSKKIRKSKKI
jgi:hypothetical protein